MRSMMFVLLAACGGNKSSPTPVSNQPQPSPDGSGPTAGQPLVAMSRPSCPDVADIKCAIDTMQFFSDQVCACKDKPCVDKVNDDMTHWGAEMAKTADKDTKPSPDEAKRAADILTKYTECMTKLMMDGAAPADPCAGHADPCGG